MPVRDGKDKQGCYAQWGSQRKYRYPCGDKAARKKARQKAHIQGAAIQKATGKFEYRKNYKAFNPIRIIFNNYKQKEK